MNAMPLSVRLCGVTSSWTPRCTSPVARGCTEAETALGDHAAMMLHGSPKHFDDSNHVTSFVSTGLTVDLFQLLIITLSTQTAFTRIQLKKPLASRTFGNASITSDQRSQWQMLVSLRLTN
jgi:hypothetical protein